MPRYKDHQFEWSADCYDVCRICGGVRGQHPEPPEAKQWTVAWRVSQQTEAGHVSRNLLRGRVHQNEGATDALDE